MTTGECKITSTSSLLKKTSTAILCIVILDLSNHCIRIS